VKNKKKKVLIAIGDYFFMAISLVVILVIRYQFAVTWELLYQHSGFVFVFLFWLVIFYSWDLYNLTEKMENRNFLFAMIMNVVLSFSFFYIVDSDIAPKTNLVLTALVFSMFFYLWRFVIGILFNQFSVAKKVLMVGADHYAMELIKKMVDNPRYGYKVAGLVKLPDTKLPDWFDKDEIKVFESIGDARKFVEAEGVSFVVITQTWYGKVSQDIYSMIPLGLSIFNLPSFWETLEQKIPINATNEIWFLENLRTISRGLTDGLKRLLDLILAIVLFPVLLSLGLIAALLVKISSKGPIFYSQIRVGLNGRPFRIFKFRSMRVDAEKQGAQWSTQNDPRITGIGRFLRSTRLDELPQIFNVLRGDMSFIGPRPERPEFVDELAEVIPHYSLRHLVRPGLTGWAQINYPYGSSVEDAARKLEYDLYYLKNRGMLLDIKIILKTIMVVFARKGR